MKIHDVIRARRQALGLTQEGLAGQLGVSAPAVNKWEKGLNYPDITLLPSLARTLGVDLNTLLSFQEDLTQEEIGLFLNRVYETAQGYTPAAAFDPVSYTHLDVYKRQAQFLIQNGRIDRFTLQLRGYTASGERGAVMPPLQATAALAAKGLEGDELMLAYLDGGGDSVSATWVAAGSQEDR